MILLTSARFLYSLHNLCGCRLRREQTGHSEAGLILNMRVQRRSDLAFQRLGKPISLHSTRAVRPISGDFQTPKGGLLALVHRRGADPSVIGDESDVAGQATALLQ